MAHQHSKISVDLIHLFCRYHSLFLTYLSYLKADYNQFQEKIGSKIILICLSKPRLS